MDELHVVRRDDRALIVATENGTEYRLIVDDAVLAELRQLARRSSGSTKIKPREIQALVRGGKSRGEIAELTGLEESDIERYEEPVLAERRYILELAQAVAVRTSPVEQAEQQFGVVIAERLISLGAEGPVWSSWRDEEAGWMIGLDFLSHEVSHRAVWSFDHRKSVLSPITSDAVTISKQGDLGDRLIPKLRAVDDLRHAERFDSGAFDPDQLSADLDASGDTDPVADPRVSGTVSPDHPSTGSIPIIDVEAELLRRRSIEDRAIKTSQPELPDLGQTADLLDALRKRRGERDIKLEPVLPPSNAPTRDEPLNSESQPTRTMPAPLISIDRSTRTTDEEDDASGRQSPESAPLDRPERPEPSAKSKNRGRPGIPSWDDILFGTRSEDDPA